MFPTGYYLVVKTYPFATGRTGEKTFFAVKGFSFSPEEADATKYWNPDDADAAAEAISAAHPEWAPYIEIIVVSI